MNLNSSYQSALSVPIARQRFYNRQGRTLSLGKQITSGGEGRIFAVQNNPGLLAKVYLPETSPERLAHHEAKIRAMLAMPQLAASGRYAWPVDTIEALHLGKLQTCGFLMPRLSGHTLVTLTTPSLLLARIPAAREGERLRLFLHQVLGQLAAGLQELEALGVIPGDVSESNFLVNPQTGAVGFLDCDSYQVPSGTELGGIFPAGAATPEYLPPELLEAQGNLVRTSEHVRFSAAVLFFLILSHGWHPYACEGAQDPVENIKSGRTAMGSSMGLARGYYPRAIYRIYREMHPALKQAFINTLVRGHRAPNSRVDFGTWQRAITTGSQAIARTIRQHGRAA